MNEEELEELKEYIDRRVEFLEKSMWIYTCGLFAIILAASFIIMLAISTI